MQLVVVEELLIKMEKNKHREARRETLWLVVGCLLMVVLGFCINEVYDGWKNERAINGLYISGTDEYSKTI